MTNTNNGPVDMEGQGGELVNIKGRAVDPDKDSIAKPNTEFSEDLSEHMEKVLEHVPEPLRVGVSKITRAELSMPGNPVDREAYEAYLGAEKIMRDLKRRDIKAKMNWKGLPKKTG